MIESLCPASLLFFPEAQSAAVAEHDSPNRPGAAVLHPIFLPPPPPPFFFRTIALVQTKWGRASQRTGTRAIGPYLRG